MKKNIHPKYHEIEVMMTDGTSFKTRSTYGKPGDKLVLDVDNKSHPAWTGQARSQTKGGRADRFQRQYGDLGNL